MYVKILAMLSIINAQYEVQYMARAAYCCTSTKIKALHVMIGGLVYASSKGSNCFIKNLNKIQLTCKTLSVFQTWIKETK